MPSIRDWLANLTEGGRPASSVLNGEDVGQASNDRPLHGNDDVPHVVGIVEVGERCRKMRCTC